jgi:cell division protein FtsZ
MGDDLVVTVIATGFERDDQPVASAVDRLATARSQRTNQQILAGVGATHGERPHKDLDRPAFLRRPSDPRQNMDRVAAVADDEWDVPTFLRKQAD